MAGKSTPKTSSGKTPSSLSELQASLKALETRMKRADTTTRNQVKALEETVNNLSDLSKKNNTAQKSALTRQVNKLAQKLEETTSTARQTVESDLRAAMARPDHAELNRVVEAANVKLASAEAQQAEAIRKVNQHLADMARAVDARFNVERTQIDERITLIETETANALISIGGKIETLSGEWQNRHETAEQKLTQKVNELAIQTQTDFDRHRESVAERLFTEVADTGASKIETDAGFERLTYQIDRLNNRLDTLEYEFTALEAAPQISEQDSAPPPYVTQEMADDVPAYAPEPVMPMPLPPVAISNVVQMPDAFAPAQQMQPQQVLQVQMAPQEYAPVALAQGQMAASPREAHEPMEFVPNAYQPPAPMAPPPPSPYQTPAYQAPDAQISSPPAPVLPATTGDSPLPYADPAYAEPGSSDMRAQRIGQVDAKPSLKDRLTSATSDLPISSRNLRVAGMAIAIGAIGLFAVKNILGPTGGPNAPNAPVMARTMEDGPPPGTAQAVNPDQLPNIETTPTIGVYADSQAPDVAPEQATTLADAAAQGNPVAEFQLGLSYLQDNRVDEAVNLIRLAANKNQPAAQYRLAKLYETGQGVTADPSMARKLTEQAARGGNRIAMHDLALYYADGRGGVDKNIGEAVRWFTEAAQRGVVDSQFNLAVLAESGQASAPDVDAAYFWYSIAAAQGDQFAQKRVAILKDTLPEAQRKALDPRITGFKPKPINEAANGIFRDVPWATKPKTASAQITQIRTAQGLLSDLGYNTGTPDGAMGPRTRDAIKSFEKANSLPETGQVNPDLIKRLELAAGA